MVTTLPISQARQTLPTLVENAQKKMHEYVITVKGVPAAVLISAAEYGSWLETNEILSDPVLMKDLREAEAEIARGEYVTYEELIEELKYDV